jgi:hypothetical protein
MSTPDLPPASAQGALGETTTSVEQVETVGKSDGESDGASSSTGNSPSSGAPASRTTDHSSGDDQRDSQGSPVADVWDTE